MVTMYQWGLLLPASTVGGHHVLSLKVLFKKRKPQIDGLLSSVLHILGQERKKVHEKLGYYRLLLREDTMHSVRKQFTT